MAVVTTNSVEKANLIIKYKKDPIKFMEECIKIPVPGGSQFIKLYEPQKRIVKDFLINHDLILLKSRQIGMSTICQAMIAYLSIFFDNCIIGLVSRDNAEASDFCRKVKDMLFHLPDWIKPEYANDQIQYFVLTNGSALYAATIPTTNPASTLRGKAITMLVVDEAAFLRNIDDAWTALSQSVNRSQQDAKAAGIPYGNIVISTPNKTEGIGKWYFNNYQKAKRKENQFIPHEIHWSEIPLFKNDPFWYVRQCNLLNNDQRKIAQELELKFIGTDSTLFDADTQEALQEGDRTPLKEMKLKWGGELFIFSERQHGKFYIIGVDTASSAGDDFSGIQVMDFETCEQIMEYKGKLEPKMFSEVVKMVARMVPHNIIVVENTGGFGLTVINELQFDTQTKFNIFGEFRGKNKPNHSSSRSHKKEQNKQFVYGLSTNGKSRPLILDSLFDYVTTDTNTIKSERLAMELLGLTNKNDKIQADLGFNDDLALSWGFCCYVRKYCSVQLGNTSTVTQSELETMPLENTIDNIIKMNNTNGSLYLDSLEQEPKQFKKSLERYIKENVGTKLTGHVNVMDLWRQDNEQAGKY